MMLKLIKYEFKNTWKYVAGLIGLMFVISVLQVLIMGNSYGVNGLLHFMSRIILALSLFGISIAIFFILMTRFYKSMFGAEGYLSFTLPVTPRALILSKMIVAHVYCLLMGVIVLIIANMIDFDAMKEAFSMLPVLFGNNSVLMILVGVSTLLSPLVYIIDIYLAMSIGQTSNHNKILMSILAFIGIVIVKQLFSGFMTPFINPLTNLEPRIVYPIAEGLLSAEKAMWSMLINLGITVTELIIGFMLTHYFCSKKLNLQ